MRGGRAAGFGGSIGGAVETGGVRVWADADDGEPGGGFAVVRRVRMRVLSEGVVGGGQAPATRKCVVLLLVGHRHG